MWVESERTQINEWQVVRRIIILNKTAFTYLLHGGESFLRSQPVNFAASQEIPRIYENPELPHHTHTCPSPVPILSQLHLVPTTSCNFLKIHLNIIVPSTSWSPQWPRSLRLPHQHPVQ